MRSDYNEMDTTMDTMSERSSLDTLGLGRQLSQLSRAKMAVTLNSVHHVRISTTYDREEHVTMYVMDVFLQTAPRGLIKTMAEAAEVTHKKSKNERRWRDLREKDEMRVDHQVEYRFSAFRTMRECISEMVAVPKDASHSQWCPYCSRVRELVDSSAFPSRFPNRGRVAVATGLHELLVRIRQRRLEAFMNKLLRAAKDVSYRSGCNPCERYEAVSRLLSDFLMEGHLQTTDGVCCQEK